MFGEQKGCCAICGKHRSEFKNGLAVDHDHKTGKIRKLLCIKCNVRLSVLENEEFVIMANRYLEENK
jgi:hypothetical protein